MTQTKEYKEMGFKLMPSGRLNHHLWYCAKFQKGSTKDKTWKWEKGYTRYVHRPGHHTCCKSRRSYVHKVGCVNRKLADDLSDLKDIN